MPHFASYHLAERSAKCFSDENNHLTLQSSVCFCYLWSEERTKRVNLKVVKLYCVDLWITYHAKQCNEPM